MWPLIGAGAGVLAGLLGGSGQQGNKIDAATLQRLFGSGALSKDTTGLYQMLLKSPQFQSLLSQNAVQGSQFQNNLAGGLAARGLNTSGIGTIANAAGASAIQTGDLGLRGGLFGQAGSMAQQNLMARLSAYTQGAQPQQPSFLSQLGGDLLGASVPSLFSMGQKKTSTVPDNPWGFK
jgi:hypothetical protein